MPELRDQLQATLGTAYAVERELGAGGMSRVFVADEQALGRKVVVKVLRPAPVVVVNWGDEVRERVTAAVRRG